MKCDFHQIRTTRNHLVVEFTLRHMTVKKRFTVRVPWRALNEQYQDVADSMADEAQRELNKQFQAIPLPLEAWE